MTESELYQSSWLLYNNIYSPSPIEDIDITSCDLSPTLHLSEWTCDNSFPCTKLPENLSCEDYMDQLPSLVDDLDFSLPPNDLICEIQHLMNDMQIDPQIGIIHLLMFYAEAMGNKLEELTLVIAKRISEQASNQQPTLDKSLIKSSIQPSKQFTNLPIFAPAEVDVINIFDFDIGEGIQWATMIDALGNEQREVRLISINMNEDMIDDPCTTHTRWSFEDTKRRLINHAMLYGVKLKVEEQELNDLMIKMKNLKKQNAEKQWFAFNCMVALPHLGRIRRRKDVFEVLTIAKNFLEHATTCCASEKCIITLGDGDAWEKFVSTSSYNEFLETNIAHFQSLLESIEVIFPTQFIHARTTMEYLFVAPFVLSSAWASKWEKKKRFGDLKFGFGLEG
ncbi:protein NODULATION SIGNALING PATHWAY 2-like [Lycium ferocissimum]|uniref:protein NODULATION SIGNALING PATHWAY 2-like n=1 Tax=Lycium ferocissimum TaxID=112874 RepID=UPI002814AE01|nr:protein NODULATION SIGNALING PATHWAY 2-like [Lycium ferocissimum]